MSYGSQEDSYDYDVTRLEKTIKDLKEETEQKTLQLKQALERIDELEKETQMRNLQFRRYLK